MTGMKEEWVERCNYLINHCIRELKRSRYIFAKHALQKTMDTEERTVGGACEG